jgi:D-alanyl-lipoteichoic acid acyltransferase DltB (MBOAT superfamily)
MRDVLGITGDLGLLPASFAQSIPPGISFYTFQLIALVIDTGSAAEDVPVTLLDYANFMSLFMQRVAGPIERRDDLLPQLQRYTLAYDADAVLEGARFVVLGLFMKLVIADELAAFVNTTEATNPFAVWLSVLSFGLRTYFDFAGYSLIAYGIARLLGIRLTLNFRAPITSLNIQEFWQRWHVTLNTWLSDYALTPLLLKWKGKHVTAALLLVFLGAGIWHGAGWNYALFGLYHGVALAIYRAYGRRMKMPRVVARIVTLSTVMGGWLLFMQPTLSSLAARLSCVAHLNRYTPHNLVLAFPQLRVELVAFSWTYLLAGLWIALEFASVSDARDDGYAIHRRPVVAQAVVAASVLFAARAGAQFVYFAF